MTGLVSTLALAISTAAILYLRATDAKRRRAFKLEPVMRRWPRLAKTLLWLPGITLIALGNTAGVLIWLGGITVVGWGVAAITPATVDMAKMRLDAWRDRSVAKLAELEGPKQRVLAALSGLWAMRAKLPSLPLPASGATASGDLVDRVAALEARIAELEATLAEKTLAEKERGDIPAHQLGELPEPPSLVVAGGRS